MINVLNHGGGMEMVWIIGHLALIVIIWLTINAVNQSKEPNLQ
jgi:hypothetical protein